MLDAAAGRPAAPPARHEGTINRAALSPDGRAFVTASRDHTARVWAVADGRPLTPPLRHDREVEWAAWGPDGRRVVTGAWDDALRVWDVAAAVSGAAGGGTGEPEGHCFCVAGADGGAGEESGPQDRRGRLGNQ